MEPEVLPGRGRAGGQVLSSQWSNQAGERNPKWSPRKIKVDAGCVCCMTVVPRVEANGGSLWADE